MKNPISHIDRHYKGHEIPSSLEPENEHGMMDDFYELYKKVLSAADDMPVKNSNRMASPKKMTVEEDFLIAVSA